MKVWVRFVFDRVHLQTVCRPVIAPDAVTKHMQLFAASATGVVTAKPNDVANVNAHECFHYSQFTEIGM